MCRSPLALTVMSMRECRARRSSMWSRKPMPVAICDAPVPSRSTATSTSVSLVVRLTEPFRIGVACIAPGNEWRAPCNRRAGDPLLRPPHVLEIELGMENLECVEIELAVERPLDVGGAAETMLLAGKQQEADRDLPAAQGLDH